MRRRSPVLLVVCSFALLAQAASPAWGSGGPLPPPGRPMTTPRAVGLDTTAPVRDALSRALASGRIDRATYALERARSLFHPAGVRARYGGVARPGPRDATLVLRDLLLEYGALSRAQRRLADAILARPTDPSDRDHYTVNEAPPYCSTDACYHWVASTADAPPLADGDMDGRPDWIDTVATTLEAVWQQEITTFGFRAPKSDATSTDHGPDGRLDIYLADVGSDGIYGYCTSDDPHLSSSYRHFDMSAYCVIDNDFAELGGVPALQVTIAHEFFHASQFAYDITEDRWFMEATATWIEDEVYDDVNDNVQYLATSPITRPGTPMDANNAAFFVYGDWIFFRFVSEWFGGSGTHDVSVVRRAWTLADGAKGGKDLYSLKAVARASTARGVPFTALFRRFAMVNDVAPAWYDEGAAQSYPPAPLANVVRISRRNATDAGSRRMRHLTSAYLGFRPGTGVSGSARLRLSVNLPPAKTGATAAAVTISTVGAVSFSAFRLGSDGDGSVRVPFGRGTIREVALVLTNASTRTKCWKDLSTWRYSCAGAPVDDGLDYAYRAALVQ